jgi:uncharacterized protein (DUF1778 family)
MAFTLEENTLHSAARRKHGAAIHIPPGRPVFRLAGLDLYVNLPYTILASRSGKMIQPTFDQEKAMSRIDARIPLSVRETIDRAAAMQGRTRTDFLIAAALEKAERVIEEQAIIRLTRRDQEALAAALAEEKVSAPTRHVMDVLNEYRNRVAGK